MNSTNDPPKKYRLERSVKYFTEGLKSVSLCGFRDCYVAVLHDVTGLSAVCDCDIS